MADHEFVVPADGNTVVVVQVVSPWNERLLLTLCPPKPGIDLTPHQPLYVMTKRCAAADCDNLFSVSERPGRLYCSEECYLLMKAVRLKLRRALTP
jgi:hypothetical protein